eukprot:945745_1
MATKSEDTEKKNNQKSNEDSKEEIEAREALKQKFNKKIFKMDEVAKHNTEESPWIVIYGAVYDMTEFQLDHPGGPDVLQDISGQDGTEEFENILHTEKARKMGHDFMIGSIEGANFDEWLQNMNAKPAESESTGGSNYVMYIIVVLAIAIGLFFYNGQSK